MPTETAAFRRGGGSRQCAEGSDSREHCASSPLPGEVPHPATEADGEEEQEEDEEQEEEQEEDDDEEEEEMVEEDSSDLQGEEVSDHKLAAAARRGGGLQISCSSSEGPRSPAGGMSSESVDSGIHGGGGAGNRPQQPLLIALHTYMKFGMSPSDGVFDIAHAIYSRVPFSFCLRFRSLPTNLDNAFRARAQGRGSESSTSSSRDSPRNRPRLTLSQAKLIIPRTESEYKDCCRFARSHSEGLLFAKTPDTEVTGALVGCRDIVPRALSEGLLGGRLRAAQPHDQRQGESEPKEVLPTPVQELEIGAMLEGKIIRVAGIGFFIDVHATRLGLLTRRQCRQAPKQMLKKGEILSNLVVLHVNKKKKQFTLGLEGIGHGGDDIAEVAYDAIYRRIAAWAGVKLPPPEDEDNALQTNGRRRGRQQSRQQGGRGGGRGRGGRGQPQLVWRPVKKDDGLADAVEGRPAAVAAPAPTEQSAAPDVTADEARTSKGKGRRHQGSGGAKGAVKGGRQSSIAKGGRGRGRGGGVEVTRRWVPRVTPSAIAKE